MSVGITFCSTLFKIAINKAKPTLRAIQEIAKIGRVSSLLPPKLCPIAKEAITMMVITTIGNPQTLKNRGIPKIPAKTTSTKKRLLAIKFKG